MEGYYETSEQISEWPLLSGQGDQETSEARSSRVGGGSLHRGRCAGGRSADEGPAARICDGAGRLENLDKIETTSLACRASDSARPYH
jgi:hypothetical protein